MLSLPLHDDEWLSLATSGGFFLTSVLLCLRRRTVTRHRKSTQSDSSVRNDDVCNVYGDTNDINDANDRKFNLECYRMRRMEDRMSFREIDRCEQSHLPYPQQTKPLIPSGPPYDTYSTAGTADTDVFDTRRRRSSEIVVQSNWNHFEGYNPDDDVQQTIIISDQQRKNVQHVNEIHPMIKSSNIFRDVSIESDSGEEILSKLLEGEDLPDQELYCGYQSPKQNSKQHKFTSPSITPPPFRASSSSTDDELTHHPVTAIDTSTITKAEPRLPNPSMYPLNHIRRARSVPDPPVDTNGIVDSQAATNDYIASNRMARAKYNASIMPNKLILIRHGQSLGNVDEKLYATTPDNAMPLTELGWEQAKAAGKQLKQLLTPSTSSSVVDSAHFIVSPYVRTVETFHGIVSAWCDPSEFDHIENYEQRLNAWYSRLMEYGLTWAEDPRIREQDFGNYQEPKMIQQAKRDRHMFGAFYYRFPLGESASDVSVYILIYR